eukprot:TRINITY_DN2432_c0_g1_i1.p1 TRINITY_DN2432_c0_g1~~TRINITY_DN2432_c0_g1_i1.p1  ORF type:complete len:402 (-),score=59.19 TRINITY_DN2432_c0_g1_i1:95-1300(-)
MQSQNQQQLYCLKCKAKLGTPPAKSSPIDILFQKSCPKCSSITYFMECFCGGICNSENPLYFGARGFCNKCKKHVQMVPCPKCKQLNVWTGNYSMGAFVNCYFCKGECTFQQVACPTCQESNFWFVNTQANQFYKYGLKVDCYKCTQSFMQLNCPHCMESMFFRNYDYTQGMKQTCETCTKSFQHFNCPACGFSHFFKDSDFEYGKNYECQYCHGWIMVSLCRGCGEVNMKLQKDPHLNTPLFNCSKCKINYNVFQCDQCNQCTYFEGFQPAKCLEQKCPQCQNIFNIFHCPNCKNFRYCECKAKEFHQCPICKFQCLKKPENLIQFEKLEIKKISQGKPEITKTISIDDQFKCKICMFNKLDTIFEKCGHACICSECAKDLKKEQCPICRTPGPYKKIFI